ncbi:hypothetical protein JF50_15955 [Pseudoalteromonas luteoviolacea]|uniref:RHS repeat-associated core domain-containing protein n=1 Tax=Pseudoalteromonas luteoviolacea TaxID=43657 RepID=A0A0C1MMV6_9GAMM|nr:RHS repeat-associated core domain-containing protein [Pseudoalteromonas luteoviolacea]KID55843.1 hypothetical protein JF50_15955 [Pseudoalteromonas luteoviolacea]
MKFNLLTNIVLLGTLPMQAMAIADPSKLPDYAYNYKEYTNNSTEVSTLTTDLLGDKVDLANGGFSISHTDLTLKVNGGLTFDITRTFGDPDGWYQQTKEFGAWSLKLPHIRSTFAEDVNGVYANTSAWKKGNACSANVGSTPSMNYDDWSEHPDPTQVKRIPYWLMRDQYWSGDSLSLMNEPTYKILEQPLGGPNENNFRKTTKASHKFSCYQTSAGSEGFKVESPSGITYHLDNMRIIKARTTPYMGVFTERCVKLGCSDRQPPSFGGGDAPSMPSGIKVQKYHVFMLPSKIEDRFGNTIEFSYLDNGRIDNIVTSDGQRVDFTWSSTEPRIDKVTFNAREWSYDYRILAYSDARRYNLLETVTLPNKQTWKMAYGHDQIFDEERYEIPGTDNFCAANEGQRLDNYITVTHPNGTSGQFSIEDQCKGRTGVPKILKVHPQGFTEHDEVWVPHTSWAYSLIKKTLSVAGETKPLIWSYEYTGSDGSYDTQLADHTKVTTVRNPDNSYTESHFSRKYGRTLNNLEKEKVFSNSGVLLQETSYDYHYGKSHGDDRAFVYIHLSLKPWDAQRKDFTSDINVEVKSKKVTTYYGANSSLYSTSITEFNEYDKPTQFKLTNHSDAKTKHVRLTYFHDENTNWLNQPSKVFVSEQSLANIDVSSSTDLAAWTKYASFPLKNSDNISRDIQLPSTLEVHGQLKKTYNQYHGHGGLKKVTYNDGTGNRTIEYDNYQHNVAQLITLPTRYDAGKFMSMERLLDGYGNIKKITNLNGVVTRYTYDDIDRITSVNMSDDPNISHAWLDTKFTWNDSARTRTIQQCELSTANECVAGTVQYKNVEHYDGLYRLVKKVETDLSEQADVINPTRYQSFEYDYKNQPTFQSHVRFNDDKTYGVTTVYDALGRKESIKSSGMGETLFTYLSGHKIKVTDPKKHVTTTTYQAFGSPAYELATYIESPEFVITDIQRDIFGQVRTITQKSANSGATPLNGVDAVTETREYDDHQNLCLIKRPDVGNTIMGHNALGQIMWQKAGVADNTCVTAEPQGATRFKYDNLGDSHTVTYPDTTPSVTYTHDNVGNLLSLVAGSVRHDYQYNNQSVLELERLSIDNQIQSEIDYGYNNALAPSYIAYPDGTTVHYSPNGFGQPTRAVTLTAQNQVDFTIAKNARYHANGTLHSFEYGNGIKHTLEIDKVTQLPELLKDSGAHGDLVNLTYGYDYNANVTSIIDGVDPSYSLISLVYDDLDRLKNVTGGTAIGNSAINYDAIGNIVTYKASSRDLTYYYNDRTNLLDKVTGEGTDGKYSVFSYDSRGNVTSNGGFNMDYNMANQMISAKGNTYLYDGYNRRVKQKDGNGTSYSLYSQSGKLLYREKDTFSGDGTNFIYLGDKLVAKYGDATPSQDTRQAYRPFGETINTPTDSIGYTGHKFDTDLNLSYMQARYYDPVIGRFYSNDPVDTLGHFEAGNGAFGFNRYAYANNNPYRYTDPTGMAPESLEEWGNLAVGTLGAVGALGEAAAGVVLTGVGAVDLLAGSKVGGSLAIAGGIYLVHDSKYTFDSAKNKIKDAWNNETGQNKSSTPEGPLQSTAQDLGCSTICVSVAEYIDKGIEAVAGRGASQATNGMTLIEAANTAGDAASAADKIQKMVE